MNRHLAKTAAVTFAAAVAIAASLLYITAPPQGIDGYRERAATTARTLVSQAGTASLWVRTHGRGRATDAATLVALEEAEHDARAAATTFEGHEPPEGGLELRRRLASLAGDVNDVLSRLRIAAEQERWDQLGDLGRPLPAISADLSRFEERAEP